MFRKLLGWSKWEVIDENIPIIIRSFNAFYGYAPIKRTFGDRLKRENRNGNIQYKLVQR
jgi:hypothetical protein